MLIPLLQVSFAAIRNVARSAFNIMLYSVLSRLFTKWLGFNTIVAFFCSAFCLSKIAGYFQRLWLNARLKNKKPDEKIIASELSWESAATMAARTDNPIESSNKFETDWNYLLDNDAKNLFPSIVNIPCNNGWLNFLTLMIVEYQTSLSDSNYFLALSRIIGFLIILICGSSVRYQTLFEREKQTFLNLITKQSDKIERYIMYSNTVPVASVCIEKINSSGELYFMVQLYQLNSKFNDYLFDIVNYICQKLIERIQVYGNENNTSIRLVWSLPSCKQNWMHAIKSNKFRLISTYKDFSFMPFVNSHVEQYEFLYQYNDGSRDNLDEKIKIE